MQSRLRAELQAAGFNVDVDRCHGAFALHKKEEDVLATIDEYALVIVDEFPQLSKLNFERIIRCWENAGRVPVLLFLGDFYPLPSIDGTNAKDSVLWKKAHVFHFRTCHRSGDDALLKKLSMLRPRRTPNFSERNYILRGHKPWRRDGYPTASDLRELFRRTNNKTFLVTCTRRAAAAVNELASEVLVGKRRILVDLPAECDENLDNLDENGKLRTDRHPIPSRISLRKGLTVQLTRNLDKAGDFVNGMSCEVQEWDAASQCVRV